MQQQRKIEMLTNEIEAITHLFRTERKLLVDADRRELVKQSKRIRHLIELSKGQKRLLQIIVFGNVARDGAAVDGFQLAMKRANEIRQQLLMFGVPGVVLTSIVNKYEDTVTSSVGYQVNLY